MDAGPTGTTGTTGTADPVAGTRLGGRYHLLRPHARGGMSTVYVGRDERLDRTVAVKVISAELAHDPAFVERFTHEARAAARLSHPNVVAVHDQGRDGDRVYLVMEYVEGGTLRDLLRQRGRLTPGEALALGAQLLAGLGAAHRAGLVHRDVKPENVLVSAPGRIRVADFGLARAVAASSMTRGGPMFGTVSYLSPEQISRGRADPRSDVYSVGVVLYEALTGAPPYTGETAVSIAYRHVHEDIPDPSAETGQAELPAELPAEVPAGLSDALDRLVRDATRRPPDERPDDAGALLDDVERVRDEFGLRGEPVPVPDPPPAPALDPQATRPEPNAATAGVEPHGWNPTPAMLPSSATPAQPTGGSPARRRGLWAAAALVVLTLLAGGIWWYTDATGGYTISSTLVGQPADEVLAALDRNLPDGVDVRTSEAYDDDVAEGSVAAFDPEPGTELESGDTVTVTVSQGPQPRPLVDVTGDPVEDAAATLTEAGFTVAEDQPEEYAHTPEGTIARTVPPAGTAVQSGDTITLVVSKGPQHVEVPDVVGDSAEDATKTLEAAGLEVATEEFLGGMLGIVSAQVPEPGTMVPPGSPVTLSVV